MATDQTSRNCLAILDHGLVISCPSRRAWIKWMKENYSGNHVIAEDSVEGFQVSTIFLGINFNVIETGPPLWFETMVFRGSTDGNLRNQIKYDALRYSTVADAIAGHAVICEKVKSGDIGE